MQRFYLLFLNKCTHLHAPQICGVKGVYSPHIFINLSFGLFNLRKKQQNNLINIIIEIE